MTLVAEAVVDYKGKNEFSTKQFAGVLSTSRDDELIVVCKVSTVNNNDDDNGSVIVTRDKKVYTNYELLDDTDNVDEDVEEEEGDRLSDMHNAGTF